MAGRVPNEAICTICISESLPSVSAV